MIPAELQDRVVEILKEAYTALEERWTLYEAAREEGTYVEGRYAGAPENAALKYQEAMSLIAKMSAASTSIEYLLDELGEEVA
jgi:hypothetical protein